MPQFTIPLILIPLLGGFVFVTYCNRTKWHAVRAEKERLTLYALIAGFTHLVIAWIITLTVAHLPCVDWFWCFAGIWGKWQSVWNHIRPFPYAGTATLAFALSSLSWIPINQYWFKKADEAYRIIVHEGGPLEQLLDHAMHAQKHVMITLKNDKVYIGRLDSSFTPGQLSRTIRILPSKSGHRGADKRVVPVVDYDMVYSEIGEDFDEQGRSAEAYETLIEDFRVVVTLDDIASISLYWEEIDDRYFKKTVPRDTDLPLFERDPIERESDPDPFLRLFNLVGGYFLYAFLGEDEWADTQVRQRRVVGITVLIALLIIILCLLSG